MYVAMRAFRANSATKDEVRRRIQEGLVPLIGQIPAFFSQQQLDAPHDTVVVVAVFQDQAGADECSTIADEWARQHLAGLVQAPPEVTGEADTTPGVG